MGELRYICFEGIGQTSLIHALVIVSGVISTFRLGRWIRVKGRLLRFEQTYSKYVSDSKPESITDRGLEDLMDQLAATMATIQEFMMRMSQYIDAQTEPPPPLTQKDTQSIEISLLEEYGIPQPLPQAHQAHTPSHGTLQYEINQVSFSQQANEIRGDRLARLERMMRQMRVSESLDFQDKSEGLATSYCRPNSICQTCSVIRARVTHQLT